MVWVFWKLARIRANNAGALDARCSAIAVPGVLVTVPVPIVDLSQFPITARHVRLEADEGNHTIRQRAICQAVGAALELPRAIAVDANVNYATLNTIGGSSDAETAGYRIQVLGFGFGQGSKKTTEYLAISYVGVDASGNLVEWSEDVQRFTGTQAYWDAVNAGLPPPAPKKGALRDAALLTFVDESGEAVSITPALRALVAKVAPATEAVSPTKKTAGQPAKKAPAKKAPAKNR